LGESTAEGKSEENEEGGDVSVAASANIADAREDYGAAKVAERVGERDPGYGFEGVEVHADGV